jgi:hypothetical protein
LTCDVQAAIEQRSDDVEVPLGHRIRELSDSMAIESDFDRILALVLAALDLAEVE